MKEEDIAANRQSTANKVRGIGWETSATIGANIVKDLAIKLQNPKTVDL